MSGQEYDILTFVYHYRYFGLFMLLSLGLLGIPVPDEFLMVFSGFQTSIGNMSLGITILVACLGSIVGMNLSYVIGRQLDIHLARKMKIFNIDKRIEKAEKWFAKYGDLLIVIGYFFPGIRHFTAYFAGMSKFSFKKYFCLVFMGAFIWTSSYILLGKVVGHHWRKIIDVIYGHLSTGAIIFAGVIIAIYLLTNWRKKYNNNKNNNDLSDNNINHDNINNDKNNKNNNNYNNNNNNNNNNNYNNNNNNNNNLNM